MTTRLDDTVRIEVRKGRQADADAFADLAPMAFEPLIRVAIGSRAPRVLHSLFQKPANLSSYEKAFFATVDGVPAAVIQGFDWEQYNAERAYTYWLYFTQLRLHTISTLLGLARAPHWYGRPQEGEYYIIYLAAYPQFRGLGLATRLLMRAEQTARERGYRSLSLDADPENALAIPLYLKTGFLIEEEVTVKRFHRNMGRLCRMRKPLA